MKLLRATEEYKLSGLSVPGFPILLWEDMSSCWEVNEFFRYYLQRGAIESRNSWAPISQALYDYFGFLEAHELKWDDVARGEHKNLVAGYRDYCFDLGLKRNTIRLRLVYVCEFYKYAERQGWVPSLPFDFELRHVTTNGAFLAHLTSGRRVVQTTSVMPRTHRDLPKFLSSSQSDALVAAADNIHHKTIIQMGLRTGLRREELATFPVAYVFDPDTLQPKRRNVKVRLDPADGTGMRTKRSKARDIWMPRQFMKTLHHYVIHHRGERACRSDQIHPQLFLNQDGRPFAANGKAIESIVRKLGKDIGLDVHPHMLRHTYATQTLVTLQRNRSKNRIEPLVFLQRQLGHASIRQTTTYLHLVNEMADDAVLAYDEELDIDIEE